MRFLDDALLIALGGNALSPHGGSGTIPEQFEQSLKTMAEVVKVVQWGVPKIVITHGNGPQVGSILLRSELASKYVYPLPLESCVAASQGGIGYTLQQSLKNLLKLSGIDRTVATVVTQVLVDAKDPGFKNPTKPIGQFFSEADAKMIQRERGWIMKEDAKRGWRQVVASPQPLDFLETEAISLLLNAGVIVITVGGGGIPVVMDPDTGAYKGVPAVVDKDLASALLACKLGIQTLCILTAVSHVAIHFGQPDQKNLTHVTVEELKKYRLDGEFAEGSMLPKINAVIQFLEQGGKRALITSSEALVDSLEGKAGTQITNGK